jgi:threonyl-tRNA synthetase
MQQQSSQGRYLKDFESNEGKQALRHTASHVLAQAVKRLFPTAKLAIGPAIENGFYYDFDVERAFTPEDLGKIEEEMGKIIKEALPLQYSTMSREQAVAHMRERGEPYKVELVNDLPADAEISFYQQGDFLDLCAGPHLPNTKDVGHVKLLSAAGAYWRGSEKNKMLQRIYGTAFPKKKDLDDHIARLEEAKKRDHNKLGRELEIFTTVDEIGQGLPILLPKGAKIIQILQRFVEDEEERRGYQLTKTPYMAKSDLFKRSGHWYHYRDGMFVMGDEKEEKSEVFALRPMTCPFQFQVFLNRLRSFRDLPMRLNETSTLFRNESSGEMHGLIRVRQFTISEAHIICTPEQMTGEFSDCVDLANHMLKTLGLQEDISYNFSTWDPNNRAKYIGSEEQWTLAQNKMREILTTLGLPFVEKPGDAAFYGPKLDIQIKNVHGKEDTLITIQLDFQLAEKFEMQYIDSDNTKKHPVVIHRTSIGCYERTLALLIEKYAGAFPVWLSPTQVRILTISEQHREWALEVQRTLAARNIRVEVNADADKIGYKIRATQLDKIPYMLVVGDKEVAESKVAVRHRKKGDVGAMPLAEFVQLIVEENDTRAI